MRILLVGDAPWHTTGYGRQGLSLARRLVKDGHHVWIFAPGGFHGGEVQFEPGITALSSAFGDDRWGVNTYPVRAEQVQPDLAITLLDAQGLQSYGYHAFPTWMWAPIDTWPVPKQELGVLGRADKVLVPSVWGHKLLTEQGVTNQYLPYGLESGSHYYDPTARAEWRRRLGFGDDTFVIGMVGINSGFPDRKGYPWAFEAIRLLADDYDDVRAFVQTNVLGDGTAPNLEVLRETMGLESIIEFSRIEDLRYFTDHDMRGLFSGFDVLLQSSTTEGFGLPVIEAQACGTSVVANDATAISELVHPWHGVLCAPSGHLWISTGSKVSLPDTAALYEGLRQQYHLWRTGALSHEGLIPVLGRWVSNQFDWDALYERHWRPLLATVEPPIMHESGERKLQLGCGKVPQSGFVHHDRFEHADYVDVAHDLNVLPWPWDDNSFDYVDFTDVLEHLACDVSDCLNELWRIIAPNGWLYLRTVEEGTWQRVEDPTHRRGFRLHSFDYYDPDTVHARSYGVYTDRWWKIHKRTLVEGDVAVVMTPRKPGSKWLTAAQNELAVPA